MGAETRMVVVHAGGHPVGFRVEDAIETMRPLGVDPVPGAPHALLGVATIRGEAVPVIDLRVLLGAPAGSAERWLTLRAGRVVAVAVDGVEGVVTASVEALPSLLRDVDAERVEGLARRDGEVVQLLRTAVLLDGLGDALEGR